MTKEESTVEIMDEVKEESAEVKPYELRRLKDNDLWPVLDIIAKVFPDDLSTVFVDVVTGNKKVDEVGAMVVMKLVLAVCKNIKKVHDEVYALLSDVSGIPEEEIMEMEFGTTPKMIMDIVQNEKNVGFFKVLSKLF